MFGQRSLLWWDLPLADSFELLRHIYRVDADAHPRTARRMRRAARARRVPRDAGAPALARATHARRADRRAAARSRAAVPRRADHRPRRREQGTGARVPRRPQRAPRHDRPADDARPRRHRTALQAPADHRPRARHLRRRASTRCATSTARNARSSSTSPRPSAPIAIDVRRGRARSTARASGCASARDATTAAELIAEVAERYPCRDLTLEEPAIEDIVRRIYVEGI